MPDGKTAIQSLLTALADLFSIEGRPGANAASAALKTTAKAIAQPIEPQPSHYADMLRKTLESSDHPISPVIIEAIPFIIWGGSDLREGRIPETLANQMPMCELIGPDGMFQNETTRVGLWMQQAGVTYGPRRHAAEETFIQFAGSAYWSTEDTLEATHPTGTFIHHPSNILHTSRTTESPVFAAWRWSGDIGFDKYSLK